MKLEGKTALITGGNSGIGLATARAFVAAGARVAITGRNSETLKAAQAELGEDVLALQADATDIESAKRAIEQVAETFGKIDIVFANAGIGGTTPVGGTSLEQFESILRTNLTAVFFTIQAADPHLTEGGSIILNGSVHAVLGAPGWSAYAATKAGIRAMTRNLASEYAPRRIRVNQVTPGATDTPIWDRLAPDAAAKQSLSDRINNSVPLQRFASPEEIANAALFLASDDSSYITGTEILLDGGSTSSPFGAPIYR